MVLQEDLSVAVVEVEVVYLMELVPKLEMVVLVVLEV
jgi:hypothetical protein